MHSKIGIPTLLFLIVLFVNLFYTTSQVTGEDSGELIIAAYALGIPHPPGYPLWSMLGHLFTYIPFGSIAWRVHLLSNVFAALSTVMLYLLLQHMTRDHIIAAVSALLFAFSRQFWTQSLIAEVYTLNIFLLAVCLYCLVAWQETRRPLYLYLLALSFGLGLCNHHSIALLGPVFILYLIALEPRIWERWRLYLSCTLIALLCLSLYLYLPIRARQHPPVNWGNPSTWDNFWAVITRRQYSFSFTENPRTLSRFIGQVLVFLRAYLWEFTPWIAVLPVVGMWTSWKYVNKHITGLLLGVALVTVLGIILSTNFSMDRQSIWLNSVFFIPAYFIAAVFLGIACSTIRQRYSHLTVYLIIILVASLLIQMYMHTSIVSKRQYHFADDYGRNLLRTMELDAIYFPTADHATFPALYLQVVEGLRDDVVIANKYGYVDDAVFSALELEPPDMLKGVPDRVVEDWLIQTTERPVYFSSPRSMEGLQGYRLEAAGLLYRVVRPDEAYTPGDYWAQYVWQTTHPDDTRGELSADYIIADYYLAKGRQYIDQHDLQAAQEAFRIVYEVAGKNNKETLNNLGSSCAFAGLYDEARYYLETAIALDADYTIPKKNLAKLFLSEEDAPRALLQLEAVLRLQPEDTEALWMSVHALKAVHWYEDAAQRLKYIALLQPENARIYRELGVLYQYHLRDLAMAYDYYQQSLAIDPTQLDLLAKMQGGAESLFPGSLDAPEAVTLPVPYQLPTIPDPRTHIPSPPSY